MQEQKDVEERKESSQASHIQIYTPEDPKYHHYRELLKRYFEKLWQLRMGVKKSRMESPSRAVNRVRSLESGVVGRWLIRRERKEEDLAHKRLPSSKQGWEDAVCAGSG